MARVLPVGALISIGNQFLTRLRNMPLETQRCEDILEHVKGLQSIVKYHLANHALTDIVHKSVKDLNIACRDMEHLVIDIEATNRLKKLSGIDNVTLNEAKEKLRLRVETMMVALLISPESSVPDERSQVSHHKMELWKEMNRAVLVNGFDSQWLLNNEHFQFLMNSDEDIEKECSMSLQYFLLMKQSQLHKECEDV